MPLPLRTIQFGFTNTAETRRDDGSRRLGTEAVEASVFAFTDDNLEGRVHFGDQGRRLGPFIEDCIAYSLVSRR